MKQHSITPTDESRTLAFIRKLPVGAHVFTHAATDSMAPTIRVNERVRLTRLHPQDIAPGDILAFTRPGKQTIYAHRVIRKTAHNNSWMFTTKGDNLADPDPLPVKHRQVLGTITLIHNSRRLSATLWHILLIFMRIPKKIIRLAGT